MPAYKAIKYFLITEEDLIKTTTLKIRRPQEQEKITGWLADRKQTMRSAHRTYIR